jgi:hypothetical protein
LVGYLAILVLLARDAVPRALVTEPATAPDAKPEALPETPAEAGG